MKTIRNRMDLSYETQTRVRRFRPEVRADLGEYDRNMEAMCLQAVDDGKFRYLEDVIDALGQNQAS